MPRAPFISLDGLDGTGKSTQCRMLAKWLQGQGWETIICADPGGTPVGNVLRDLLLDRHREMSVACEAFLFMASRAELTSKIIAPALAAGRAVVADRYLLANVVYQGHAGGLDPKQLWDMGMIATDGLEPDLTLVLDLPAATALGRRAGGTDRVESRAIAYHERVREGFLIQAQRHPDRIRVVDAGGSIPDLHQRICHEVASVLAKHPRT